MQSETIGRRIRALRLQKGWTLKYVGDQLGLSFRGVSRWELDKVNVPSSRIEQLAHLFEVTPGELFPDPASCATTSCHVCC